MPGISTYEAADNGCKNGAEIGGKKKDGGFNRVWENGSGLVVKGGCVLKVR